jgi:hypothetical protein
VDLEGISRGSLGFGRDLEEILGNEVVFKSNRGS